MTAGSLLSDPDWNKQFLRTANEKHTSWLVTYKIYNTLRGIT